MRAVLVGIIGRDKLFYDLDAKLGQKDAIVERENGSTVKTDLLSFAASARGLSKIRSTRFHRFLWDTPRNTSSGAWYETFVTKERAIKDEMLDKIETHSAVGENRKKIRNKSDRANAFISRQIDGNMLASSCCNEMIKSNVNKYIFNTSADRKIAWEAMKMLRFMEEKGNVHE